MKILNLKFFRKKEIVQKTGDVKHPRICLRNTCVGCPIEEEMVKTHPRGKVKDIIIIDGIEHIVTETRSGLVFGTRPVTAEEKESTINNNDSMISHEKVYKKL